MAPMRVLPFEARVLASHAFVCVVLHCPHFFFHFALFSWCWLRGGGQCLGGGVHPALACPPFSFASATMLGGVEQAQALGLFSNKQKLITGHSSNYFAALPTTTTHQPLQRQSHNRVAGRLGDIQRATIVTVVVVFVYKV